MAVCPLCGGLPYGDYRAVYINEQFGRYENCGPLAGLSDDSCRQARKGRSVGSGSPPSLRAGTGRHIQQVIAHAMLEFSFL